MERLADDTIESFMNAIEERLAEGQKNKIPFSRFLEEKWMLLTIVIPRWPKGVSSSRKEKGRNRYVCSCDQTGNRSLASGFHAIFQRYLCYTWNGISDESGRN